MDDLSRLKLFICACKFKMLTVQHVHLALCYWTWFMAVDLERAYWHVPIHPQFRRFLAVQVGGIYQTTVGVMVEGVSRFPSSTSFHYCLHGFCDAVFAVSLLSTSESCGLYSYGLDITYEPFAGCYWGVLVGSNVDLLCRSFFFCNVFLLGANVHLGLAKFWTWCFPMSLVPGLPQMTLC